MSDTDKRTASGIRVNIDLPVAVAFLALAFFIVIVSGRFPDLPWRQGGSPAFYPRILAGLIAVFAVAIGVKSRVSPTIAVFPSGRRLVYMVACFVGCILMPVAVLPLFGFRIAAFVFMFLVMLGDGEVRPTLRRLLKVAGLALLCCGVIWAAFTYLARVRLPLGSLTGW